MLTGGIEAAEGNSYLSGIGARVNPLGVITGAGADPAVCGAAGCGAPHAAV